MLTAYWLIYTVSLDRLTRVVKRQMLLCLVDFLKIIHAGMSV